MANALVIEIPKLSDGEVLTSFLDLAGDDACKQFDELEINFFWGELKRIARTDFLTDEELKSLRKSKSRTIRSLVLRTTSGQSRGVYCNRHLLDSHNRNQQPQVFDSVEVQPGNQGETILNRNDFSKIVEAVHNHFRSVSSRDLGPLLGPDVQQHFVAREEALSRLEQLAKTILEDATEQRRTLDKEYLKKVAELEESIKVRREELDEDHRIRLTSLSEREAALDSRAKDLDDRSSTHVRRELRDKLKEAIKSEERMKFTSETGYRRLAVAGGYVLLLLFTGIPAIYFLFKEVGSTWDWAIYGRQIALSISFLFTAGFFVRWLNAWAEKSSSEELRLKQMEIDIDRASWLVELIFESSSEKGEALPTVLVQQLAKNLFGVEGEQPESNAADTLATALLGSASGLKLSLPGGIGELAFDGKSIKKLERTPTSNE